MWYKRSIPLIIVFSIGLLGFAHDFIPHPISAKFREVMTTWLRVMGGFGLALGIYALANVHYSRIRRVQAGWGYSIFFFVGAGITFFFGLYNSGQGPIGPTPGRDSIFSWLYQSIQVPCTATIFSILAFFMASAAFRTFRARNLEAALLLVAAIIVMFGRVPISELISDAFPIVADKLLEFPNAAAKRGILLGVSLGAIAQSVRILFGIERSYFGGRD
jgi:hypothetical protein